MNAIYTGDEFPEFNGVEVEAQDDYNDPANPTYAIYTLDNKFIADNIDDDDLEFVDELGLTVNEVFWKIFVVNRKQVLVSREFDSNSEKVVLRASNQNMSVKIEVRMESDDQAIDVFSCIDESNIEALSLSLFESLA